MIFILGLWCMANFSSFGSACLLPIISSSSASSTYGPPGFSWEASMIPTNIRVWWVVKFCKSPDNDEDINFHLYFRPFQYSLFASRWHQTWFVTSSSQSTGCSSPRVLTCGSSMYGTQVRLEFSYWMWKHDRWRAYKLMGQLFNISIIILEKGVCIPTVFLWLLFIYVEASIRLKEFKASVDIRNMPFHLDLCRPFAAHWWVTISVRTTWTWHYFSF